MPINLIENFTTHHLLYIYLGNTNTTQGILGIVPKDGFLPAKERGGEMTDKAQ